MTVEALPRPAPPLPRQPAPPADLLDREVSELMRPGCLVISDVATVEDAASALLAHGAEAVLVVSAAGGTPLGWISAGPDLRRNLVRGDRRAGAATAITEPARGISPRAHGRAALYALSLAGTTRLLVRDKGDRMPLGVVTRADLVTPRRA